MKKNTQTSIAAKAGITQSAFSKIINGHRRPHYLTAKKLEKVLGVPLKTWMEGTADEIQAAMASPATQNQEVCGGVQTSQN